MHVLQCSVCSPPTPVCKCGIHTHPQGVSAITGGIGSPVQLYGCVWCVGGRSTSPVHPHLRGVGTAKHFFLRRNARHSTTSSDTLVGVLTTHLTHLVGGHHLGHVLFDLYGGSVVTAPSQYGCLVQLLCSVAVCPRQVGGCCQGVCLNSIDCTSVFGVGEAQSNVQRMFTCTCMHFGHLSCLCYP